jgi:hypothetical protein
MLCQPKYGRVVNAVLQVEANAEYGLGLAMKLSENFAAVAIKPVPTCPVHGSSEAKFFASVTAIDGHAQLSARATGPLLESIPVGTLLGSNGNFIGRSVQLYGPALAV